MLGLGGRPIKLWGNVTARGRKGLNHVLTNDVCMPWSEVVERCYLAAGAGCQVVRGPGVAPWMMRDSRTVKWLRDATGLVRSLGMDAVGILQPDLTTTNDLWRAFVRSAVSTFDVAAWEVDNEPDNEPGKPPGWYADRLATVHEEASRQRGKEVRVWAPALGHGKHWTMQSYLKALYPGTFDVLSVHVYDRWDRLRDAMRLVPDVPVAVTEDGATRWTSACLRGSHSKYLADERVRVLIWYCMRNPEDDAYSLLDADLKPRRAWDVWKDMEMTA